nr:immunoglobulin light chain junction region [Homo sapiens]
RLQSKNFPP